MNKELEAIQSIQEKLSKQEFEFMESALAVNTLKIFIGSSSKHLTAANKRKKEALKDYEKSEKNDVVQLELLKFD